MQNVPKSERKTKMKNQKALEFEDFYEELMRPIPWYKRVIYFPYRISDKAFDIKMALQRAFRGHDDLLLWNLHAATTNNFIVALKYMRKRGISYPGEFDDIEEWNLILDQMIIGFEAAKRIIESDYKADEVDTLIEKFKHAWKLAGEYYFTLWD